MRKVLNYERPSMERLELSDLGKVVCQMTA